MATIQLRTTQLAKFRKMLTGVKTDDALAVKMGVNPATVSLVLSGKTAPGPRFIAGLIVAFAEYDVDFNDLFEVVDSGEDDAA